jgi:Cytidylyltransferase-like
VRRGAFPGSFNPPTVAHLAIAEQARQFAALDQVDLVVSRVALGKEDVEVPTLDDRIAVLEAVARTRPWLAVRVTDDRLLADIARGYDALIVGADKWAQVRDPSWYASVEARDAALAALPRVLVVPRAGYAIEGAEVLALDDEHGHVSSTAARDGRLDLMLPEALEFDAATGAWSDPDRYRAR